MLDFLIYICNNTIDHDNTKSFRMLKSLLYFVVVIQGAFNIGEPRQMKLKLAEEE